jgi:hypothetical protein
MCLNLKSVVSTAKLLSEDISLQLGKYLIYAYWQNKYFLFLVVEILNST